MGEDGLMRMEGASHTHRHPSIRGGARVGAVTEVGKALRRQRTLASALGMAPPHPLVQPDAGSEALAQSAEPDSDALPEWS